jgi:hypothetical protein
MNITVSQPTFNALKRLNAAQKIHRNWAFNGLIPTEYAILTDTGLMCQFVVHPKAYDLHLYLTHDAGENKEGDLVENVFSPNGESLDIKARIDL